MRAPILPILLVLGSTASGFAAIGDVAITSFFVLQDRIGEIRGKVELNGEGGALVTVKNGGATYTTATDAAGKWSLLLGLRSNNAEATARGLDGRSGSKAAAEAVVSDKSGFLPPLSPELFALTKGMLQGDVSPDATNTARLAKLMDDTILHGGGWELDQRFEMLLLGCVGRIVEKMSQAQAAERESLRTSLAALGRVLYRGVVRGMDGQPPAPAKAR